MVSPYRRSVEVQRLSRSAMGLILQLFGLVVVVVAGFELWRFLVGFIFTLIMKAGLLANIRANPHTKISVTAATLKISLWTHLLKFLCSPTQEKLVVVQLLHVRLLVETTDAALAKPTSLHGQSSQLPSFLQTLDTNIALLDIRHPMWTKVRLWIPRLLFLCRCVHAIEVDIGDISVDVVRNDKDAITPVLSIQHGSVCMSAMFHEKSKELSLSVKLSQSQPMKVAIQQLEAHAALGSTEIRLRVPISHNHEDVRAPIPSAYSVVCELIQVNLNFEHLVRSFLCAKPQPSGGLTTSASDYERDNAQHSILEAMTILRLAEIIPNNLRVEIKRLEVNIINKISTRGPGSACALELSRLCVVLSGDSSQECGTMSTLNYPVVARRVDLMLGPLVIYLSEGDGSTDITVRSPALKLEASRRVCYRRHIRYEH
ncbi:hypothetical protein PR002_g44 [Phytophthora rubi]|uniref:Uncharacterized protein n=1 Tax=Phytophthora rubi TaxID=129364 RepID=A0A6A3P196_9STRA|nr:hypothetical protein PR002_g44 [Phytophthora rubi]